MKRGIGTRLPGLLSAFLLLSGCAGLTGVTQEEAFSDPPPAVELTDVPFHPQEAYHCGPAALAEMLGWTGVQATPDELAPSLYIPDRKGTLQTELVSHTRQRGRVPYRIDGTFDAIVRELRAGNPVMVFQNLGLSWWPVWHYAVIVGYDPDNARFILRSGTEKRVLTTLDTFRRTWDRGDRWALVITAPERLPASAEPRRWYQAAADLERTGQQTAALKAHETGRAQWPEYAGFHLGLVNARHAAGDLDGAEKAARRGLRDAADNHGVLYNNLAMILAERRAWDAAEEAALNAVAHGGRFDDVFRETLRHVRCRGEPACMEQASPPGTARDPAPQ